MRRALPILALALALLAGLAGADGTRVACIGDSITFGAGLPDREHLCYPAQLGERLGTRFEVRNFGVGGRTLLRAGDLPYMETEEWRAVLAWRPQIAVVILGTNDTVKSEARPNWPGSGPLVEDARAMARALLEHGAVRVLLCAPPPMFPDAPGLDEARRADLFVRAPRLELVGLALAEVAAELPGVQLHDLARVYGAERTTDGVHPDPFGAEALAVRVAGILARNTSEPIDVPLRRAAIDGAEIELGTLAGFARYDFPLVGEEQRCTLVAPHVVAQDDRRERPWLHRLRLDEADLGLDLALLDAGFHVVYCDAPRSEEDWGARQRWRALVSLMQTMGLGERWFSDAEEPGRLLVDEPRRRWRWGGGERTRSVPARPRDVLAAAGLGWNPAAWPATSAEHRAGAGWNGRSWREEVAAMRALAREHRDVPIALLGDSITQGLTGVERRLARAGGERAFDRHLGERGAIGLGLAGDRTEHLLWRVERGALAELDPRVVVLQIGVNNVTAAGHSAEETAEGIAGVVASILQLEPQATVVVCGPFPAGAGPRDPARAALADARAAWPTWLARMGLEEGWRERVRVLDLWPLFLDREGRPNERMAADGLHLSAAGQEAWLEALGPVLDELLE